MGLLKDPDYTHCKYIGCDWMVFTKHPDFDNLWNKHNLTYHNNPVNLPSHYTDIVPGIECIEVTEHFDFLRGNAIKYLWRAGAKGNLREDLEKAKWYIQREIDNLDRQS